MLYLYSLVIVKKVAFCYALLVDSLIGGNLMELSSVLANTLPLTGDRSNIYLYAGILVACLIAAILVVLYLKKNNKQ